MKKLDLGQSITILANADVIAPEREMELSIVRYQAKVAREQILRAAQADNAN